MKCKTFTDGGSRGNPGPAALGGVIFAKDGQVLAEVSEYIGHSTNNQAEYQALVTTLQKALELGATEVDCYLDSLLVVNQVNRVWKIKDKALAPHALAIHNLCVQIGIVRFYHVPREQNTHADALVNKALDNRPV